MRTLTENQIKETAERIKNIQFPSRLDYEAEAKKYINSTDPKEIKLAGKQIRDYLNEILPYKISGKIW